MRPYPAAGVEHELITIPDGPHSFDVAGDRLDDPTTARAFHGIKNFPNRHPAWPASCVGAFRAVGSWP